MKQISEISHIFLRHISHIYQAYLGHLLSIFHILGITQRSKCLLTNGMISINSIHFNLLFLLKDTDIFTAYMEVPACVYRILQFNDNKRYNKENVNYFRKTFLSYSFNCQPATYKICRKQTHLTIIPFLVSCTCRLRLVRAHLCTDLYFWGAINVLLT